MKPVSIPIPLVLSAWLSAWAAGCDGTEPAAPDAAPDAAPSFTITIVSDEPAFPAALVVFRDGIDGAWQPATMKTPTTFEAEVHGPYVVTIVCQDVARGLFSTYQLARTPDDDRDLVQACDYTPPTRHAVVGSMVQAGRVQIEDRVSTSNTPGWGFNLGARSGTHDLLARTADRIALRRAIVVSGDTQLTPPIDLDLEGAAFAEVAFTATNAAPSEALVASVHLDAAGPFSPLSVYSGPIATAKVAPDSVLVATDQQSASIQATAGNAFRALRRPFRVGGNTAYTLPAPLEGVQWELAGGNIAVKWTSVPELDTFVVATSGASDATKFQNHYLDLSPRFVAATGIKAASIDTDLPGYKPEWKVNFARQYVRGIFVQRVANGEIASSSVSETVNAGMVIAGPAPRPPLAHARLAHP